MKIIEQRLLRGPNLYSSRPSLLALIDLEQLTASTSELAGFNDRLLDLLPDLHEHRCSVGQ